MARSKLVDKREAFVGSDKIKTGRRVAKVAGRVWRIRQVGQVVIINFNVVYIDSDIVVSLIN